MVVADLHVHTTNSDGTLTLESLPSAARDAGLEAIAITDHDRIHPELDQPVTVHEDSDAEGEAFSLEIIHGIELRVESSAGRVDLLGYGVERTRRLESLVDDLQENRIERGSRIVECVEDHLDVELDVTLEPGVGRPHIARAIERSKAPYDYQGAFDDLIGNECPCYVSRDIPSFERGLSVLRDACGLVGLAHPLRYSEPEAALTLLSNLDAVELYYPYGPNARMERVEKAIEEYDVLVTGGSDAHDEILGRAGLDRGEYESVRTALGSG